MKKTILRRIVSRFKYSLKKSLIIESCNVDNNELLYH
jgi:hypothetical protein